MKKKIQGEPVKQSCLSVDYFQNNSQHVATVVLFLIFLLIMMIARALQVIIYIISDIDVNKWAPPPLSSVYFLKNFDFHWFFVANRSRTKMLIAQCSSKSLLVTYYLFSERWNLWKNLRAHFLCLFLLINNLQTYFLIPKLYKLFFQFSSSLDQNGDLNWWVMVSRSTGQGCSILASTMTVLVCKPLITFMR